MAKRFLLIPIAILFAVFLPFRAHAASAAEEKDSILALISRMEAAWNRGDFRGYMDGFANPDVVFVSRGQFRRSSSAATSSTGRRTRRTALTRG